MGRTIRIGTRGSRLALAQTGMVRDELARRYSHVDFQIEIIKTTGDKLAAVPLTLIGGQGVFTKELQDALLERRIDIAVHSLKDLPTVTPDDLTLAAIPPRENPFDALCLPVTADDAPRTPTAHHHPLELLRLNAVVGTSSLRRATQIKLARPDIKIKDLRGNVDTRLRKLDSGEYDAIVLAAAGLRRLGFDARITSLFSIDTMLPAIGQGALGLETRHAATDVTGMCRALDDAATRAATLAERSLLRTLGGGCQLPIAAHALIATDKLFLHAFAADTTALNFVRASHEAARHEAEAAGATLAAQMLSSGAQAFLTPTII